ncbi:putative bacteriocin (fragment) (putative Lactococcin 972 family bacteriocin) (fragment) [Brochothrix thermosphacta]|uniref:Putative bacteriocin (Putative Lactococcin 972 family bacteriocin) n=1 Tax=Brochothrix thermosphacta TaxID=2756 RepID=A0A2X0S900_BROTH
MTVVNYTTSSGWISKNKWAKASAKKSLWSTSQFYWNTK